MRLQCLNNKDEYKQLSDCIKARNHTLLGFLHRSRKWYIFFQIGTLHWTWWLPTLARHRLYRALHPKL